MFVLNDSHALHVGNVTHKKYKQLMTNKQVSADMKTVTVYHFPIQIITVVIHTYYYKLSLN